MEVKLLYKSLQVPKRDLQQINIDAAFYLHLIRDRVMEVTMLRMLAGIVYICITYPIGKQFNTF